jgi:hypothetical protein
MGGWNLMCNVDKIVFDVGKRIGELHLPELNYPDMTRTIRAFTSVDPEIEAIYTYVGGEPDTQYMKTMDGWVAHHE